MAVTFVVGRAGSGKTRRCFDSIVAELKRSPLGPPIYWLLPKQATFTAERELTCLSGLGAFCRARVVSFEEFGRDVFDDCGGSSIPQVTALGRQMILGHLLRQHKSQLRFFSKVARQPGLPAELDTTFAELERCGKSGADLAELIEQLGASNGADLELAPLLDKLHDAKLIHDAYTAYLGQERLDQHRRAHQVEASLSHCSFLGKCAIYADGFADFTAYERRILAGGAKAGARIEITLLIDPDSPTLADPHKLPDELSLFGRTENAYRKLYFTFAEQGVTPGEPVRLRKTSRFVAPGLASLESGVFREPIPVASVPGDGVELLEAPDRTAEVDAVARQIRALVVGGFRYREVGVLVRDLDPYHALIDASFREHGIPYFADRRRQAGHHPLLQAVRALFQIARNDWPPDSVMAFLRGGLTGVSLFEADGLENYVLRHHIRGVEGWESAGPWKFRDLGFATGEEDPDTAAEAVPEAERLRSQLVAKLAPFIAVFRPEDPRTVRAFAGELFATLERFEVRRRISERIAESARAGGLEQSAEHEQVWLNFVDLLDQMIDLLGDEPMSPGEFKDVLEAGLDGFDLALTPPTLDQVLVGQVDRTRSPQLRAVFVLGLSEGEFPRPARDGSILNDRDRRTLRQRRIDLDPGMTERLFDERRLAYVAFTRASERLYLSRSASDEDARPAEPSPFWRRVLTLFPQAKVTTLPPRHDPDPAQVATPRQLLTGLMRWVRSSPDPAAGAGDSAWPALYHWLANHTCCNDAIDDMRYRAWRALSYDNSARLSPEVAGRMFSGPLEAQVPQLESFAVCPFQHFLRYALGLSERDRQELNARDMSRLYHQVLEQALAEVLRRRAEGDTTARLEDVIEPHVRRVGADLENELMLGTARNRYVLDRARRMLERSALAQREALRRGQFRPTRTGVRFGGKGKLPPLEIATPGGASLRLGGKIDRLDLIPGSGEAAVVDYRLGKASLSLSWALNGLSLQLPTNLLFLETNGRHLLGKDVKAAAGFYLQVVRAIEPVDHPSDAPPPDDPRWHLKLKPRGVFDKTCVRALDRDLTTGPSEVVQVYIKQDGNIGFPNTSDAVTPEQFKALLQAVSAKLGQIGDEILSGKIDVAPYRLNNKSPCANCGYRSVCRFDPAVNRYNRLTPITLAELSGEGSA